MKFKGLLKPAVSLVLLGLVLSLVDLRSLLATLLGIPLSVALVVITGYALGQVLSAYKWLLLARAGDVPASFLTALKSYFIGMFVNCFGLGIVGGDVTRGVLIAGGTDKKTVAIASVIADRAHGLAVLALVGTVATVLLGWNAYDPKWIYLLIGIGASVVIGWFFGPVLLLRLVSRDNPLRVKAEQVARVFPKTPAVVLAVTFLSLFFHVLQIVLHWVMGYGLGVTIPWAYLFVTIPFVNMASSLPISWNGLGVRETAYIFFLTPTILTEEQAVAFGALWLLAVTVTSCIGGIVSFLTKDFSFSMTTKVKQEATKV